MLDKYDITIIRKVVKLSKIYQTRRNFKGLLGASLVSSVDKKLGKEVMAVNAVIMTFISRFNNFATTRPFEGDRDIAFMVLESWGRRVGFEENLKKMAKRYLTPDQQERLLEWYDYLKVTKPENEIEYKVKLQDTKINEALKAVARNFEAFFYGCDVYDRITELNRLAPKIKYGGEENIPLLELPFTQPQYKSLCTSIYVSSDRQMYSDKKNGYTVGDMLDYIKNINKIKNVSPNAVIAALDKAGIRHPYGSGDKAKEKPEEMPDDEVVEFIRRRFAKDCHWLDGNCYYFAMMLKARFPQAVLYYDVIDCHFLSEIDGKFYDWKGLRETGDNKLVKWDEFAEYDKNRMQAVIRGCIE